jgi:S-adenosylmethionine synthetase
LHSCIFFSHEYIRKGNAMTRLLTSESVTEGHPDKVCDIISDSILDAYLAVDPDSRVAVETSAKDGLVVVEGEVSAPRTLDHVEIVRKAIADIGYTDAASGLDAQGAGVINNIRPREFDSNDGGAYGNYGDDTSISREDAYNTFGGDQGLMVGYASDDTEGAAAAADLCSQQTRRTPRLRAQERHHPAA